MVSLIISILTCVAVLGAIYLVIAYFAPYMVEFVDSITAAMQDFSALVPPWLLAFALIPLVLFVIGIIIKLL